MSSPSHPTQGGFAQLTRQSAIFSLGALAGKLIALVMVPILTRAMTRSDFGRYDVLSALTSALISALLLGIDTAASRLYFDQPDPAAKRQLMGTWLMMAVLLSGVPCAAVVLLATPISRGLFGSPEYGTAVALVGANLLAATVHFYTLTVLRVQQRATAFAAVAGAALVITPAVTLLLLVVADNPLIAVMVGLLAGSMTGAAFGLALGWHEATGRPSAALGRTLMMSGLPVAAGTVVLWLGDFFNRAALIRLAGAEETALFSVAFRFGSVGVLVVTGFQLAWQPRVFERGTDAEAIRHMRTDGRRIVVAVSLLTAGIALLAPELLRLIGGSSYALALPAVGWALALTIGSSLFQVASMPVALSRDFRTLGLTQAAAALTAGASTLLTARHHGAAGVMFSLALGQLIAYLLVIARGRARGAPGISIGRAGELSVTVAAIAIGICGLDITGAAARSVAALVILVVAIREGTLLEASAWIRRRRVGAGTEG